MEKEIIKLKRQLEESGIDTKHLVYMPEVPMIGIDKSYVIEVFAGIKVAKLIGTEDD